MTGHKYKTKKARKLKARYYKKHGCKVSYFDRKGKFPYGLSVTK